MRGYREVFRPAEGQPGDPGKIFYTITEADLGKGTLPTTAGPIHVADVIGRVQAIDVGKRLYRVQCDDPAAGWIWQCESDRQRDERLGRSEQEAGS